ncbi:type VI secretion system-associated protein TagF [Pseudopelagicola sp. nBUS_20]|mgnify:CR=1 FL=1|uniref:type VI secretion system-associated protein TagF n=1 Tax=Pseudopelagicola sp. nBUS_20 TaxID=3395317 RepID=UPI003EBFCC8A
MSAQVAARSFGAFGKIPALGDFLRFNLPAEFIAIWDGWLQAGMLTAKEEMGVRWDECYLTAPIWRFSLPRGIAGKLAVSGILMPSVDRVGRRYPLTLAATCQSGNAAERHFSNTKIFEKLEDVALAILDKDLERNEIAEALFPLSMEMVKSQLSADAVYFRGEALPEHVLAANFLTNTKGIDGCVWTTHLDGENRMLRSYALPDPAQIVGLFDLSASVWNLAARTETK